MSTNTDNLYRPSGPGLSTGPNSVFRYVDWVTVILYLLLVIAGAISIYAASYDFDHANIFSFDEYSGKQLRWIGLSMLLGLGILLVDSRVYETYAYPVYAAMMCLLLVTIFIAPDIKGSHSWIKLGPISLQPAEFAKFATSLALAKLFAGYGFSLNASRKNYLRAIGIIMLPIMLILAQRETGSALAYLSLFFVLYREGMSGIVLLSALCAVLFFVVSIKFSDLSLIGMPIGELAVFMMIMFIVVIMTAIYCRNVRAARNILIWYAATTGCLFAVSYFTGNVIPSATYIMSGIIMVSVVYLVLLALKEKISRMYIAALVAVASVGFLMSVNYAFDNILQPHQQQRIKVTLGMEEDLRGAGYNVNQSKIAIGSGGITGKGFLNGTQTKLKYVPEQHTDFIYCTIGEEEGFIGSAATLLLFVALIFRVITLAERQPRAFARVYGYCVASILIFHVSINVGMVIGLCPVIGIPLPFFSYGGSSLWGFTTLLFILLRLDASRRDYR
ncbi:MAG: rod shape-determining protein RodA [Pseudoflavonifractor sp.]|nr:rod shape-determining protein RodA [Alloprevotella sp.]MCM1117020.1 rod shape-determining protein RodA [Pseudoflavonifractor sp.]